MTAPNHIVGGIAITGISLSFWDINIFSNSIYLSLCIFSSLLPDIDHTKSLIGKLFFPLAKYLDTKFGHRTITHSLTFLIPIFIFLLFFELQIINPIFNRNGIDFSLIFLFAFISHLILDMLTVQGIPLFYPFMKNPCVIPANPTMRFRSGNIKSEAIALFIFTFVLFSSYDLFKNGFWTTYNRSFGTLKHAFREFKDSENMVNVYYEYSFNGIKNSGFGYILEASENRVELWNKDAFKEEIVIIDNKDLRFKNITIEPTKSPYKYSVKDYSFFNIPIQKLNDSLNDKVVSGEIISSNEFIMNGRIYNNKKVKLNKTINPNFKWIINDSTKKEIHNKIDIKKAKLNEIYSDNSIRKRKLQNLKNQLIQNELNLKNSKDIYSINKYEKLIISNKKSISNFTLNLKNTIVINEEIEQLKKLLEIKENHYFTGNLKIFYVPKNDKNFKIKTNKTTYK